MATNLQEKLIPRNIEGKHNDLEHKLALADEATAIKEFKACVQRLFSVNDWKAFSGEKATEFYITDKDGNECNRPVEEGDYLKIDIPAPGNQSGDGYDWVKVEKLVKHLADSDYEGAGFTVRAAKNPTGAETDTAHFFSHSATSTFMMERKGKTIVAGYHGRNESVNKEGNIVDKVRNTLVGAGALAGLSEVKWNDLMKSLLKPDEDK